MKKLIVIALLIAACSEDGEVEPKFCYNCVTITTATGYSDTSNQRACGLTVKEANQIEKQGTGTTTQGGVTIKQRTQCNKI